MTANIAAGTSARAAILPHAEGPRGDEPTARHTADILAARSELHLATDGVGLGGRHSLRR
jgi:hypothetical protein